MDTKRIIETLGLVAEGDLAITDIQMVQWGRDLVFECRYHTAPDEPVQFRLIFQDCREIKYKVYAHISMHEHGQVTPTADIAELLLGKGNHRRDANILTNHFGVTVSYGQVVCEWQDQEYTFD